MTNPLVSWSDLVDSAGRKIRDYQLKFADGGILSLNWRSDLYATISEFVWYLFMGITALSATMMKLIADPRWLDKLDSWYRSASGLAFSIINPVILGAGGFVVLLLWLSLDKVKATSRKFDQKDYNRISAASCILVGICILAANPLMLLKAALSIVQTIVMAIAGDKGDVSSTFSVDAMIRQPTLLINYGGTVGEDCADTWSKNSGFPKGSKCLVAGSDAATAATPILAGLAFVFALTTLAFAGWATWKFIRHISVAVVGFVSLPWVAAGTLFKRRQFDSMGTVLAIAAGNLVMVFVVQIIAIGGPTLVTQIIGESNDSSTSTSWAVPKMIGLIVAYLVLLGLLVALTNKNSALVRAIKADTLSKLNSYIGSSGSAGPLRELGGVSILGGLRDAYSSPVKALGDAKGKVMSLTDRVLGRNRPDEREDLQEVQRTEQVPDPDKKETLEVVGGETSPDTQDRDADENSDSDEDAGAGSPDGDSPSPGGAGGAGGRRNNRNDMSITLPGGVIIDMGNGVPSKEQVRHDLVEGNLTSDDPALGGRSPETLLEDMSDDAVARAMGRAKDIAEETVKARDAEPLVVDPDGNVLAFRPSPTERMARFLDARDAEMSRSAERMDDGQNVQQVIQQAAAVSYVTNHNTNVSNTDTRVNAMSSSYVDNSRVDASDRSVSHSLSNISHRTDHHTSTTNVSNVANTFNTEVKNTVNVQQTVTVNQQAAISVNYPSLRTGENSVIIGNSLKGSAATRGDVQSTRSSSVCDRAGMEVLTEHAVQRARALGMGFLPSIPLSDHRSDIGFTPDNPHGTVAAKYDRGFGDRIF
ncbi:MAG: hypothetical protein E6R04_04525 [Spirochaetes bacterium]|nr:MAG: hypothetical protein E6R04_04525 [Spirochaetota bacterium]